MKINNIYRRVHAEVDLEIPNIGVLDVDASCMINGIFKDIEGDGNKYCSLILRCLCEKKFSEDCIEEVSWHCGDKEYSDRYARHLGADVLDDEADFIYFEEDICNFFSFISQSLADDRSRSRYRDFTGLFVQARFKDGTVIYEFTVDLRKDITNIDQLYFIISGFQNHSLVQ